MLSLYMITLYNMSLVNVCRAEIYFRSSGRTANLKIDLDVFFSFELDDV